MMYVGYGIIDDLGVALAAHKSYGKCLALTFTRFIEASGGAYIIGEIEIQERDLSDEDAEKFNQTIVKAIADHARESAAGTEEMKNTSEEMKNTK